MEIGAFTAGEFRGVEGMAGIAAAITSVAGFVNGLAGIVTGDTRPDAATPASAAAGSEGGDPLREFADACLDGLAVVRKVEAATAALKVRLVDAHVGAVAAVQDPAAGTEWVRGREMASVAEVACVLTVGERAAAALIGESRALTGSLPAALDALQAGEMSWQNARVLVDETTGLDPATTAALEAHFLGTGSPAGQGAGPVQDPLPDLNDPANGPAGPGSLGVSCLAGGLAPARLRRRVRSWREREHPESIQARHVKGAGDRRMEYSPDRDAMAWIMLYLPADRASAVWNRTTATARGLQGPEESRTLPQLRADIAADLLLGAGLVPTEDTDPGDGTAGEGYLKLGKAPAPRAQVLVTVPVFSLLGATDEPAVLDGHGPIPASMARRLVAEGAESFYRVLVDPRDGAPLEIGRTRYRIPEATRRWLRLRDGKCPFPGCSNHSLDTEADHLLAWQHGGGTGVSNLGQPCRKHHRMKHTSGWQPTPAGKNEPPGWISPSGRHYRSEHQDWHPPSWPDNSLPDDFLSDLTSNDDSIPPDHQTWNILRCTPITL